MRKVWVIAAREYRASIRSKAFIISLVMIPILMGASILIQVIMKKLDDTTEKTYAVVDRTPGQKLFDFLEKAVEQRNEYMIIDPETKKQIAPRFKLVRIDPSSDDGAAISRQQFELSQRVQKEEFHGFLEIGANLYHYPDPPPSRPNDKPDDSDAIRYQTNKPTQTEFSRWAEKVVNQGMQQNRFEKANLPPAKIQAIQQPAVLKVKGLSKMINGGIEDASDESQVAAFMVPAALIALMFTLVMIGATPAMQGVVEEKMQRIAEVLLGSVKPFQLMLGKLGGMIGVSLTVAALYIVAGYFVAYRYHLTEFLSPLVLAWFLVFQVLAILMYGSLFLAIGAAASDMKETQSLVMPIMIVAMLPLFVLGPIVLEPNSLFATLCSFFPPSTPMLMTARVSVPPGIPWWQPVLGVVGVLATTLGCVYVAGRIFRVGILMQGKGAKLGDLVKWVVRG